MEKKFIFYNIFEGCISENRFEKLIQFTNKNKPDILAISEANFWEKNNFERLNQFKEKTNFKHHVFSKSNTNFNLAIFSNIEIKQFKTIVKNIWHSILIVQIEDVNYIIVHLNPFDEKSRLVEIDELKNHINPNEKIIITGDFNSISKNDNYDEKNLILELEEKKISKFIENGELQFKVHERIEKLGFKDIHYSFYKEFDYTVPTKFNKDKFHFTKLRLDFFYVSKNLVDNIKKYEIIKDKLTNEISDHYPIVLEIE